MASVEPPDQRPLINDQVLREQLAELERTGVEIPSGSEGLALPPSSARREANYVPIPGDEIERLKRVTKAHGLELINDGGCYRCKRQRDFMVWTLAVSPLLSEERGGGEAHALQEMVRRFCE
jgi:hypothetical protein